MTTDNLNLSNADEVTVDFTYVASSMDNSSEDFWLQVSTNGGSSYTTVEEWNLNDEFVNEVREFDSVIIPGPFTSNTRFRFRCDASGNSDWVYIDDVVITACINANLEGEETTSLDQGNDEKPVISGGEVENVGITNLELYPVPTSDELTVVFDNVFEIQTNISIVDMYGSVLYSNNILPLSGTHAEKVNTSLLNEGIYFVMLTQDNKRVSKRFVVLK